MGDWMTIRIVGTCDPAEVNALEEAITVDADYKQFHCLCGGLGLAGLPMWAHANIDAVGNCAERNYDANSVRKTLEDLAKKVPSLAVKVHCGGEHESQDCVATVTLKDGVATIGPAEVKEIGEVSESQMMENFMAQVRKQRRGF